MRFASEVCFLLTCAVLFGVQGETADDEPFLEKFRYGLEVVRRLFSAEPGSHFGGFFSSFKSRSGPGPKGQNGQDFANNLLSAVIESISGSQQEITKAGIKISILVAKMISDAFPQSARMSRKLHESDPSLLTTVLTRPQIRRLLTHVQDPRLTEKVMKELGEGGNNDCVRLLICKLSPVVSGMQRALTFFTGGRDSRESDRETWKKSTPMERMYLFLPKMNDFLQNGDVCDERHPACLY